MLHVWSHAASPVAWGRLWDALPPLDADSCKSQLWAFNMSLTGLSLFPHIKYGCIHWKNKRLAHSAHWRRDIRKAGVLTGDLVTISSIRKNNPFGVLFQFSNTDYGALSPSLLNTHNGRKDGGPWLWGEYSKPGGNLSKSKFKPILKRQCGVGFAKKGYKTVLKVGCPTLWRFFANILLHNY